VYRTWVETNYATQWCYDNFIQVRSMKKARDVYDQLSKLCERAEIEIDEKPTDSDGLRKAVLAGYFYNTAKLQGSGDYRTIKNPQTVHAHPSSALAKDPPRWVVFHELVFTTKEYMRTVTEIRPEWLVEIAPHYYQKKDIDEMMAKKLPKAAGLSATASNGTAAASGR
jgi:pre-mRNA-splicing factor ATP-dependent RNA helicase DHX16